MKTFTILLPRELHYGDCSGADYEAFCFAKALGMKTICHPPDNPAYRMFTAGDETREPSGYLTRNMAIVDESDYVVAVPKENSEITRSGTWMTVRYARRLGRTVLIILPDGRIDMQRTRL